MRLSVLTALFVLCAGSVAWSQQTGDSTPPSLESVDDIIEFLESFEGGPDELQQAYENLSPAQRTLVDENFEPWSLEGGLSLMGGALLGQKAEPGFRMGASLGMVWPAGDYDLPIYYAFTEIAGPWAIGWTSAIQTDNFGDLSGAVMLHWAYEYIGTTPMVDAGPVIRLQGDELGLGAKLDVGYGNILVQGYVAAEVYSDSSVSVFAGVRIPWLLATIF